MLTNISESFGASAEGDIQTATLVVETNLETEPGAPQFDEAELNAMVEDFLALDRPIDAVSAMRGLLLGLARKPLSAVNCRSDRSSL
jgi:hypothetical protein